MSRLSRSISAEWRKVRSTKLWWILAIVLAWVFRDDGRGVCLHVWHARH